MAAAVPIRADIEAALQAALETGLPVGHSNLANLAEPIRYSLLAPGKRIRARLLMACAQMVSLHPDAALNAAVALEMIYCFARIHDHLPCMDKSGANLKDTTREQAAIHNKYGEPMALLSGDALIPLAVSNFLKMAANVETTNLLAGLQRLLLACGPFGATGGLAEERFLNSESTLDDLRQVHSKKTGALIEAALLIPKDLVGIPDDSSQGLALEIFSKELGFAFQTLDDLLAGGTDLSPAHILYYLPLKEAKSMTLQRLNSASLSLSSTWSTNAQPLIHIADEIARRLDGVGNE